MFHYLMLYLVLLESCLIVFDEFVLFAYFCDSAFMLFYSVYFYSGVSKVIGSKSVTYCFHDFHS